MDPMILALTIFIILFGGATWIMSRGGKARKENGGRAIKTPGCGALLLILFAASFYTTQILGPDSHRVQDQAHEDKPVPAKDFGIGPDGRSNINFYGPPSFVGPPEFWAKRYIDMNWDKDICPSVVRAYREDDDSIMATCSNGEIFKVFNVMDKGTKDVKRIALRCSALPGGCYKAN